MKKYLSKTVAILAVSSALFTTSCSDDDNVSPKRLEVQLTEVGHGTPAHAHAGEDLHLEAEILAEAQIATVTVSLHHETDSSAPEITATYQDYNGLINATFHKHIDIPATQTPGSYHLHLTVTDQLGNTKQADAEVQILTSDDDSSIAVNLTELGHGAIGNSHVHAGQDMHIEGTITSVHPIQAVSVEIRHASDVNAPEINAEFAGYAGLTSADFHEHIAIPASQPSGTYHFHLNVTDDHGHTETVHYDIEIE